MENYEISDTIAVPQVTLGGFWDLLAGRMKVGSSVLVKNTSESQCLRRALKKYGQAVTEAQDNGQVRVWLAALRPPVSAAAKMDLATGDPAPVARETIGALARRMNDGDSVIIQDSLEAGRLTRALRKNGVYFRWQDMGGPIRVWRLDHVKVVEYGAPEENRPARDIARN